MATLHQQAAIDNVLMWLNPTNSVILTLPYSQSTVSAQTVITTHQCHVKNEEMEIPVLIEKLACSQCGSGDCSIRNYVYGVGWVRVWCIKRSVTENVGDNSISTMINPKHTALFVLAAIIVYVVFFVV